MLMGYFFAIFEKQHARYAHHFIFFRNPLYFIAIHFIPIKIFKLIHDITDEHIHPFTIGTPIRKKFDDNGFFALNNIIEMCFCINMFHTIQPPFQLLLYSVPAPLSYKLLMLYTPLYPKYKQATIPRQKLLQRPISVGCLREIREKPQRASLSRVQGSTRRFPSCNS